MKINYKQYKSLILIPLILISLNACSKKEDKETEIYTTNQITESPKSNIDKLYDRIKAGEYDFSGTAGDNIQYYYLDGLLNITGSGEIVNTAIKPGEFSYSFTEGPDWMGNSSIVMRTKAVVIDEGVTKISENCFLDMEKLTSVKLANTITEIGTRSFIGCDSLKEIDIPDSVTIIGDAAFYNCENLKTVTGMENVEVIGKEAFYNSSLEEINLGSNIKGVGNDSFNNTPFYENIQKEIGKDSDLWIIGNILYKCVNSSSQIDNIVIPDNITVINDNAFHGSEITKIVIPSGIREIRSYAFCYCENLKEITFEDNSNLETISNSAFSACKSLKEIKLPASVKECGVGAFASCDSLEKVDISETSIRDIRSDLFEDCINLETVILNKNIREFSPGAFKNCTKLKLANSEIIEGQSEETGPEETGPEIKGLVIQSNIEYIDINAFTNSGINPEDIKIQKPEETEAGNSEQSETSSEQSEASSEEPIIKVDLGNKT